MICTNNNVNTKENPSVSKVIAAVYAVNGLLSICPIHEGKPIGFKSCIVLALESSYALVYTIRLALILPQDKILLVCLSGRGDKDVDQKAQGLKNGMIQDSS